VLKYIHPHLPLFGRASVISPSAMRVLVLIGEALNAAKDMVDFDGSRMAPGSTSICGLGGSMCLLAPLRFESVEVDRCAVQELLFVGLSRFHIPLMRG
jgi:hypothetical protein